MFWEPIPLLAPSFRDDSDGQSGSTNTLRMTYWIRKPDGTTPKPGIHYRVMEELNNMPHFIVFPDIPILRECFRHAWILQRCARPYVPQPDGTPMPERAKSREERCRLLSIYLRPWVLERQHATTSVPHITALDIHGNRSQHEPAQKRLRLSGKQMVSSATAMKSYESFH